MDYSPLTNEEYTYLEKELKQKGYNIETREDYVSKGTFSRTLERILKPVVYLGTGTAALVAGGLTAYTGFKTRKAKIAEAAVKENHV